MRSTSLFLVTLILVCNVLFISCKSEGNIKYPYLENIKPATDSTTVFAGDSEEKLLSVFKLNIQKDDTIIKEQFYAPDYGGNEVVTSYEFRNKNSDSPSLIAFTAGNIIRILMIPLSNIHNKKIDKFKSSVRKNTKAIKEQKGAFENSLSNNQEFMMFILKQNTSKDSTGVYGITWSKTSDYNLANSVYELMKKQMPINDHKISIDRIE